MMPWMSDSLTTDLAISRVPIVKNSAQRSSLISPIIPPIRITAFSTDGNFLRSENSLVLRQ
jgi:hypothetical protein